MHVLLEGIVPKHLGLFLSKVISLKLVDINKLNGAIQGFSYQYFESSSKPSTIPLSAVHDENLTGKQSGIRCMACLLELTTMLHIHRYSASQMRCLLHILPILLGDVLNSLSVSFCYMIYVQ